MSWYLNQDDLLKIDGLAESIEGDLVEGNDTGAPYYGYPATFWTYDGERLTQNKPTAVPVFTPMIGPVYDEATGKDDNTILTSPYPASFWVLNAENRITNGILPTPINEPILTKAYPASFWWYEETDNRLEEALLPQTLPSGAFVDCSNLTYVRIPASVKEIGRESFLNTGLTLVRIPEGCRYYSTSFPPGCEVQFYSVN